MTKDPSESVVVVTFQWSGSIILFVQSQSFFKETQREIIFSNSMQNETNIRVKQGYLWMILSDND
jgi:hypothetical protein